MSSKTEKQKYAAFISYRHLSPDKEIAHALHKLLEHNMVRPNRKVRRNIRPVFLDTSELPLVEDLDQSIKDALDCSECLFVVCSPNLPLSKYCMEEIRYFKQQHGGSLDRVYTILVAGEPKDSFPHLLRTKLKSISLPDGTQTVEEIPAEPLFADVRGKTLFHSYWKLFKSEYLRLAAAYFKCGYDELYKRGLRWSAGVACAVLLGLSITGAAFGLNSRSLKADAITSHAEQSLLQGDELLAMALCEEAEYTASQRYQAALRSAVVQYDYKQAQPVSVTRLAPFLKDNNSVRYLSAEGNQIITMANAMLQITDAATGRVYLNEPQDRVFIIGEPPETYLRLISHKDESGVMRDYISLYRLSDHSLIREFSYRESDRDSASYQLYRAVETDTLLAVSDGKEYVAFLTSEGEQLTKEEYVQLASDYLEAEPVLETVPYGVVRDKRLGKYVLKDQNGRVVLEMGAAVKAYDMSDDERRFAWMDEKCIHVYDTSDWSLISRTLTDESNIQKLHLLNNSTYFIAFYLDNGESIGTVYDWISGARLMSFTGAPLFSPGEQAFFVAEDGEILRYDYRGLEIDAEAQVLTHAGKRTLAVGEGRLILADNGEVVLETDIRKASDVSYDAALSRVLVKCEGDLVCYGGDGSVLWTESSVVCGSIAGDGASAVWLDADGMICVADGKTGRIREKIDRELYDSAGEINALAVSGHGVCAVGELHSVWLPFNGGEPVCFDAYGGAWLYEDGILILEDADARVLDFMVYDVVKGKVVYQPESNTGAWDYSPKTGLMIRHVQTSGNNPTLTVELLKKKGNKFVLQESITLPEDNVEQLFFDSSGRWLNIDSDGRSIIYRIKGMEKYLDATCSVYYEGNAFYSYTVYGAFQYSAPVYSVDELRQYVSDTLKSNGGVRTLTEDERIRYGI